MNIKMKEVVGSICAVAVTAASIVLRDKIAKGVMKVMEEPATYRDAVDSIMDSSMFSDSKEEALRLLKFGKSSDYYSAVIKSVRSTAFSDSKINMIKILNEKVEES